MRKDELNRFIENCTNSLDGFVLEPLKKIEDCIIYLDSFQKYLTENNFSYLLEKANNISDILDKIKIYLEHLKYLDPDLMDELLFFIKGAFLDLSQHVQEIIDQDLEALKNKYWQKILFLNDWVKDFLKLPETYTPLIKEKFEKYLIFELGRDLFTISIQVFVEMILLEEKSTINEGFIQYKQEKIPLVDRKSLFGDYPDNLPKKILILRQNNSIIALEVDKTVNFLDLNIKQFLPIELVTGESYMGPIDYITLLEGKPIFVLNPQIKALRPLTT